MTATMDNGIITSRKGSPNGSYTRTRGGAATVKCSLIMLPGSLPPHTRRCKNSTNALNVDRQTDRQTNRQTDRLKDSQTDRQTKRQTDKQTDLSHI